MSDTERILDPRMFLYNRAMDEKRRINIMPHADRGFKGVEYAAKRPRLEHHKIYASRAST